MDSIPLGPMPEREFHLVVELWNARKRIEQLEAAVLFARMQLDVVRHHALLVDDELGRI